MCYWLNRAEENISASQVVGGTLPPLSEALARFNSQIFWLLSCQTPLQWHWRCISLFIQLVIQLADATAASPARSSIEIWSSVAPVRQASHLAWVLEVFSMSWFWRDLVTNSTLCIPKYWIIMDCPWTVRIPNHPKMLRAAVEGDVTF